MFKSKRNRLMAGLQAFLLAAAIIVTSAIPSKNVSAAPTEVATAALGIDVARYQGQINWDQVAASGVQFAMIRVGYRTQTTGILNEDPYARYNLQEANRVGIKVGAYFFSSAVTPQEAVEEATWTANLIDNYQITYPVAYDCEGFRQTSSRQYALGNATRTSLAVAFLDTIAARGYTPMFYASRNEMTGSRDWDMAVLNKYKVWAAWYPEQPFPVTPSCNYAGPHAMWQYTSKASISGINGVVDMNVAYFNYSEIASAKSGAAIATLPVADTTVQAVPVVENVQYTDVYEVVSATTNVNLRTEASTANKNSIVVQLRPGDMLFRTGVGNNGWSKVLFNNQTYYVNTSYLKKII